ncbi:MAG TPA: site-2 protease family protein [Candidatus Dormibacteraeota bacterium]|nr:site-2 protease family protein [Candidatus Dormibacteraeota bacterium]
MGGGVTFYVVLVVFALPGIIVGFTVHELCHALVATGYGDPLPRSQGRLSFNPANQIDPLGLVMLLVIGFGFARPVQYNPVYVRRGGQRAWLSAAGPLSNLGIALVLGLGLRVLTGLDPSVGSCLIPSFAAPAAGVLYWILVEGFFINVILFIFNLIPIPPLDGFGVAQGLLGSRFPGFFQAVERQRTTIYLFAFLLIFIVPQVTGGGVAPVYGAIAAVYSHLWGVAVGTPPAPTYFPSYQYLLQSGNGLTVLLHNPCLGP